MSGVLWPLDILMHVSVDVQRAAGRAAYLSPEPRGAQGDGRLNWALMASCLAPPGLLPHSR